MISAPTIAPGSRAALDNEPACKALAGWEAPGAAGRLVTLVRGLLEDPALRLGTQTDS